MEVFENGLILFNVLNRGFEFESIKKFWVGKLTVRCVDN